MRRCAHTTTCQIFSRALNLNTREKKQKMVRMYYKRISCVHCMHCTFECICYFPIVSVNMQVNNSVTSWFINVFNRGNVQKTVVAQNTMGKKGMPLSSSFPHPFDAKTKIKNGNNARNNRRASWFFAVN